MLKIAFKLLNESFKRNFLLPFSLCSIILVGIYIEIQLYFKNLEISSILLFFISLP